MSYKTKGQFVGQTQSIYADHTSDKLMKRAMLNTTMTEITIESAFDGPLGILVAVAVALIIEYVRLQRVVVE